MAKSSEVRTASCGVPRSARKNGIVIDCEYCGLDAVCELLGYGEGELKLPEGTLLRSRPVSRGETLFETGDPFRSFFAVKSGSFKTITLTPQGEEKVIGFYFPGEMVGTEGIAVDYYTSTACAMENSAVCELRMDKMYKSGCPVQELQDRVISILGNEIAFYHRLHTTLIRQSSEQRLAAFLLSVFARMNRSGTLGMEFRLSMSRSDIASYLGLASETVSRILMKLQKLGMINIRNKQVQILELDALAALGNSG